MLVKWATGVTMSPNLPWASVCKTYYGESLLRYTCINNVSFSIVFLHQNTPFIFWRCCFDWQQAAGQIKTYQETLLIDTGLTWILCNNPPEGAVGKRAYLSGIDYHPSRSSLPWRPVGQKQPIYERISGMVYGLTDEIIKNILVGLIK